MTDGGRTALYRLYDERDVLLYVGITGNPETRFRQHAADKPWWPEVARKDVEWYGTRRGAEMAEVAAIKLAEPYYNRDHSPNAAVPVVVAKAQQVGLDLLCRELRKSRADVLGFLLDRELAARGLLGATPCFHSVLDWPDGIAPADGSMCGCGRYLAKAEA